jgi:FtsP/CotA-like multicopper oxidase with cupredoxin domain
VTINGNVPRPLDVRAGERIRLRLINAANARIFSLDFGEHRPVVIAVDGQPLSPYETNGTVLLGPAMRIDLVLDMVGRPGSRVPIQDSFYPGLEYPLTSFLYAASPLRQRPLTTPVELRPNPLVEPNPRNARRHEIVFGGGMPGMIGGMMVGGGMRNMNWTVNGVSATGHVHDPLFTIPRGQTSVLNLKNETAWWHPIHLHGHSFRVLSRNGTPIGRKEWQDTILIPPRESAEIAFVGDNPGDWMLHCHILEHQEAGMMATIKVS